MVSKANFKELFQTNSHSRSPAQKAHNRKLLYTFAAVGTCVGSLVVWAALNGTGSLEEDQAEYVAKQQKLYDFIQQKKTNLNSLDYISPSSPRSTVIRAKPEAVSLDVLDPQNN